MIHRLDRSIRTRTLHIFAHECARIQCDVHTNERYSQVAGMTGQTLFLRSFFLGPAAGMMSLGVIIIMQSISLSEKALKLTR